MIHLPNAIHKIAINTAVLFHEVMLNAVESTILKLGINTTLLYRPFTIEYNSPGFNCPDCSGISCNCDVFFDEFFKIINLIYVFYHSYNN